ncbi:hypothetical protein NDR87_26195 [Nocardia sp. CDC159]|uniref:Uncharacterized protein n=1 Tax=Nocardia pulmonis TaxID=2951408 RepID=A0A9X2IX23_9NOCA|nr:MULTISPECIES: hypothetical protein [Nocardia]MCM6774938.1 hypothetical protein [Nocardia pulmonis]MCM6789869.1 hypothetical protein [Nocardia sp. CDC159]
MITIGELQDMAAAAEYRGDARLAELLAEEAHARTEAASTRSCDEQGRRWWPTAAAVPIGVMFRSTSPLCEIPWRREVGGCRELAAAGDGRVYAVGIVDHVWAEGGGFVETTADEANQIARQQE